MSEEQEDHSELVHNFREVCVVDDDIAFRYLSFNQWNLEQAVQHYFQTEGQLSLEEMEQNESNSEQELRQRRVIPNGEQRAEGPRHTSNITRPRLIRPYSAPLTWREWFIEIIKLPFLVTFQSIIDVLSFFWHLFISPVLSVANPHADVHKFIEDFESRYCDGRKIIDWMDMSYEEALRECKASLRFMIVYLHSPSHQSTEHFIRSTLLSVHFQTLITENNIAMWGASVRSQEGYKVSMALRENTYPFMGLLCVRDHRMALILRLEGEYVLSSLLTTIQGAIEENKVFLDAVRSERNQRELNNQIRREQEADYRRGLEADRARLYEQRKRENEKREAKIREAEEHKRDEAKKKKFEEIRARIASSLPPETKAKDAVRVVVRFPCGARFERAFDPDDSLERLFDATLANEKCPLNFSLVSSYPRRSLNCAPEWYGEFGSLSSDDQQPIKTFREAGFEKSFMVLVQDNDA